jgi:hypothetical protein
MGNMKNALQNHLLQYGKKLPYNSELSRMVIVHDESSSDHQIHRR